MTSPAVESNPNEWHVPWIHAAVADVPLGKGDLSTDVGVTSHPPSAPVVLAPASSTPIEYDSAPVRLMLQPCMLSQGITHHAEELNTIELYVEMSTPEAVEQMVDDTTWLSRFNTLTKSLVDEGASGGIFVHAGLTASTHAARDKGDRFAAALLLRMMRVIEHMRNRGLKFMLIIPWPAGSNEDLRDHALAKPVSDCGASGFDLDDVS